MILLSALLLSPQVYSPYELPPAPSYQSPMERPDKRQIKDLERRLERAGHLYETLGRCAGSLTIEEVQGLLTQTQAETAGGFLIGRFEQGMKRPRDDDDWCRKEVEKATDRLNGR